MIAHLRGVLLEKHPNQAIVDVQGVGYDLTIPVSTFTSLPDPGGEVRARRRTPRPGGRDLACRVPYPRGESSVRETHFGERYRAEARHYGAIRAGRQGPGN